jgi:hypothetical protein
MTYQGNRAYVRSLQRDILQMYVTVKPKTMYMFQKQGQAREKDEKIRPRVNRGFQAMIRQEPNRNESNLRRKVLQTLRKKIQSPVRSPNLLRGKSLYG